MLILKGYTKYYQAMIDGHGDDLFRFKDKVKINFSTNIPQTVNHDGLIAHLYSRGAIFGNYPEPEPRSVEKRLAQLHNASACNILVTNGATEAIYLIALCFAGGKSTIIAPTFREYQDACEVFGHDVAFTSTLSGIEECNPDLVWLCNPNNPTGRVFAHDILLDTIDSFQDVLFVVDQAYALYSIKPVLTVGEVLERKNVLLLNSLTKQFAVPGLRIGYAVGPEDVIEKIRAIRMPWSVNAIAIEAAHYLLAHSEDYAVDYEGLHSESQRISSALNEIGIMVEPTDCNFILARLPNHSAYELKEWLIGRYGILIRDASNFEGLTKKHFRVAVQSREENDNLIKALKEWISL